MKRYAVFAKTGLKVASGIYHLDDFRLLDGHDCHDLTPAGTFLYGQELLGHGWSQPAPGIYLCHEDTIDFDRTEEFDGCCGPDGDVKNILEPNSGDAIAYEIADCWTCRSIRFDEGEYRLEEESDENAILMTASVEYQNSMKLVGAACGRNEEEAKMRLMNVASRQYELECSYGDDEFPPVTNPFEVMTAENFFKQVGDKDIQWLFRKY